MIEQGMFDVGHPVTRAQLQAFAFAAPTMVAGIDALLNVAVVSDAITPLQVARILDGSE
jgi:hypothetical protein